MRRLRNRILNTFLILLIICLSFSCQTVETESGMKKQFSNIEINQKEVRLKLNEYAIKFSGEVIASANEINDNTDDLQIKQNTLLWKMNSIPAANRILFIIDPYAAGIDMWAFAIQMKNFFKYGNGRNLFGEKQSIAINTAEYLEEEILKIVKSSVSDSLQVISSDNLYDFVEKNPIKDLTFNRQSTIEVLAKYMADHERSIASSVGSMETAVSDLSMRLNIYYDQFPKIASWYVEYLTNEAKMSGKLDSLQKNISSVTQSFERLADTGEQAEHIINSSIVRSFEELVDLREKILEELKIERAIILSSISDERTAVMNEINKQRLETIEQLEDILNSTVSSATLQMENIVDYVFIRLIILIAIGYLLFLFTYRLIKNGKL